MNKYVVSTTGSQIPFNLSRGREIIIDTLIPILVGELEARVLTERLGTQIKIVMDNSEVTPEVEVAPVAPETPTAEVETTPEVAPETTEEVTPEVEA